MIPHLYNGHNKTFFFFAYEEYRNAQTLNQGTITVPTQAYRNGDLSSLLLGPIKDSNGKPVLDCLGRPMINGAVYNPATTRTATCTDGSSAVVRDPFPNNFIGAPSTWDPVAQKILAYIPTPSGATANALTNNYPNLQPNNKFQYLTSIEIDHSIGESWHFSGNYIAEQSNKDNAADGINGMAAQTRWNTTPAPQVYLNTDYTVTPKLVLHGGFSFTRHNALQNSAGQNFDSTSLGLNTAANMPGGAAHTFPIISGLNVNRSGVPNLRINNAPFYDDNGIPPSPRPGSMAIMLSSLAAIFVIRCLALITTYRPDLMASVPMRRPCRQLKAKTFMEPASAMLSRASLLASWMAQISGTITFNGFIAKRAEFTRWTPGGSRKKSL